MVMLGNNIDGAFAEFTVAPAKDCFHLPPEIPLMEASVIADAISTPFHAVTHRAQMKPGDRVAVFGCGGVGMNCVQIAAATGGVVIAVDVVDSKLEMAKRLGASEVINAKKEEKVTKKVRSLTGGGADIAMECIGNPETIRLAYDSIKRGGRVVIVGYPAHEVTLPLNRLMYYEQEMVGSLGCRSVDFPKLIEMVRMGKIQLKPIVSGLVPLDRINEGLDIMRKGETLRTVIVMK